MRHGCKLSVEIWSDDIIKSQLEKNVNTFQCHLKKLFIRSKLFIHSPVHSFKWRRRTATSDTYWDMQTSWEAMLISLVCWYNCDVKAKPTRVSVYILAKNRGLDLDTNFQVFKYLKPSFVLTFTWENPTAGTLSWFELYHRCGSYKWDS